jgi:hypothetical protein
VNLFKGEMTFIRKGAGVTKSARGIEPADESKTIPCMKGSAFLLQEEKERALY